MDEQDVLSECKAQNNRYACRAVPTAFGADMLIPLSQAVNVFEQRGLGEVATTLGSVWIRRTGSASRCRRFIQL
jgi:hypothetical protein